MIQIRNIFINTSLLDYSRECSNNRFHVIAIYHNTNCETFLYVVWKTHLFILFEQQLLYDLICLASNPQVASCIFQWGMKSSEICNSLYLFCKSCHAFCKAIWTQNESTLVEEVFFLQEFGKSTWTIRINHHKGKACIRATHHIRFAKRYTKIAILGHEGGMKIVGVSALLHYGFISKHNQYNRNKNGKGIC